MITIDENKMKKVNYDYEEKPPNKSTMRLAQKVIDLCDKLNWHPSGYGPIADSSGGMEICFTNKGNYCNFVFNNNKKHDHIGFIPYEGDDILVEDVDVNTITNNDILNILKRFKSYLYNN